jgi:hypothetical protein
LLIGGYVFALILPPVGFVLGVVLSRRWGRKGHGRAISLLSVVVLATLIVVQSHDDENPPPPAAVRELDKFTECLNKTTFSPRAAAQCEASLRQSSESREK